MFLNSFLTKFEESLFDKKSFENHPPKLFSSDLHCVKPIYINNGKLSMKNDILGHDLSKLSLKMLLSFQMIALAVC